MYEDLDPKLNYIVAVTYANDHVYNRVQSMWADGIELHGPYALPKAKAVRLICKIPPDVTSDGKMALEWRIHGEVNATVSIIELWASGPPPGPYIRFGYVIGTQAELAGKVLDLAYEGVKGAKVSLTSSNKPNMVLETITGEGGRFSFERRQVERLEGDLQVVRFMPMQTYMFARRYPKTAFICIFYRDVRLVRFCLEMATCFQVSILWRF